jgi:hypothetical protein
MGLMNLNSTKYNRIQSTKEDMSQITQWINQKYLRVQILEVIKKEMKMNSLPLSNIWAENMIFIMIIRLL